MSVMDEMKNVVTVGRELLSTVSGKMKEIDDKVDRTVSEITETITTNQVINYYVDSDDGSDEQGTGASGSPFKTLNRALELAPSGAMLTVNLKRGLTYEAGYSDKTISCYAQYVLIVPSTNNNEELNLSIDATTPIINAIGRINFYGSSFGFGSYRKSVKLNILSGGSIHAFGAAAFYLYGVEMLLNKSEWEPYLGGDVDGRAMVKISLLWVDISTTSGRLSYVGTILSGKNVTGVTNTDDLINGATRENTLSNMPFSS